MRKLFRIARWTFWISFTLFFLGGAAFEAAVGDLHSASWCAVVAFAPYAVWQIERAARGV